MKLGRSIALSLSLAGASALGVACGGTVEHSPQTSASAATKAPIGQSSHGVVRLVGNALGEVPLRPEQRAEIEKLAADADARHAPIAEERRALMTSFADQIEKGTIDRTALQPGIDRLTANAEKASAGDRGALVKLHDILDTEQRNAFVDALEKNLHAARGHRGETGHEGGFGRMKQMADDLKLTDAQRSQIRDVMREAFREGAKQHHEGRGAPRAENHGRPALFPPGHGGKKALEAFREDKLDLDKLHPAGAHPSGVKSMAAFGMEHMMGFAEKLLPILTPEQRKVAAEKVRSAAASGDPE